MAKTEKTEYDEFSDFETAPEPEAPKSNKSNDDLVQAPEGYYVGPSEEQLSESAGPTMISDLQLAMYNGEPVEASAHPLDQGGDSARVWLEEHPEDMAGYDRLEQTGLELPEDATV